ncbi:hypothetical protein IKQ21_09560, partial [bacterium]|nr:hypothetical protein [bacterium]
LRYGIHPIIIVLNNEGYTIERYLSENPNAQYNDIAKLNYSKFARAFDGDIWATRVTTTEDFDKALKVTQIMNKMCYIEACLDKNDIPKLTRKISDSFKNIVSNEPIPETIHKEFDITELTTLSKNSFEYETVVHQGIKEGDE